MDNAWKSTEPFYWEGSGARKSICMLLIHGFTGNPGDFRRMGQYLNGEGFSVQAIRLPGHGTTPEEMNDTRWEDWWNHTLASYDLLAGIGFDGRHIIPVGYSMGGLLALMLSLKRHVGGLVTLAAPIFLQDRRVRLAGIVKHFKKYIHKQPAISEYLVLERGAYSKTPLACVESLYKQMRGIKRLLPFVHAPLFIGHGLHDGTVRPESAEYIHQKTSSRIKELKYYPDITHAIMADARKDQVFRDVLGFVEQLEIVTDQERVNEKAVRSVNKDEADVYSKRIVEPTLV